METTDKIEPVNINDAFDYIKKYNKLKEENYMLKEEIRKYKETSDDKKEYFKLREENHMLEEEIKKYKEALIKICLKF